MLFKKDDEIHIVKTCPHTKASSGVLEFTPELVAKVAGAVGDNIEWMVLLLGERSTDGFHVKVTDFRVPKQRRSGSDVKMAEPMDGDGSTVDDAVVGVLHSHHKMGAFFSGTDNTELNPFFKSSIVVAQAKVALGFNYKAEGKIVLPCGSVGSVPFFLKVTDSERWTEVEVPEYDGKAGFGDCDKLVEEVVDTETETVTKKVAPAACGLSLEVKSERAFVFGCAGGESLLMEIRQQSVSRAPGEPLFTGGGHNHRSGGGYGTSDSKMSRRERKRFRREGKLLAQHSRTYSMGSSGADACDHGVLLTAPCRQCGEGEGDFKDNYRYAVGDGSSLSNHHDSAAGVMISATNECEFDLNGQHDVERVYHYRSKSDKWSMWLCAECYDWWLDGANEAFEDDVEQSKMGELAEDGAVEQCLHGVSLDKPCGQCDDDTPPKLITDGARKWDNLARQVLTYEDYEKAKKEHVQSLMDGVTEKEGRAKALKVEERLGITTPLRVVH